MTTDAAIPTARFPPWVVAAPKIQFPAEGMCTSAVKYPVIGDRGIVLSLKSVAGANWWNVDGNGPSGLLDSFLATKTWGEPPSRSPP